MDRFLGAGGDDFFPDAGHAEVVDDIFENIPAFFEIFIRKNIILESSLVCLQDRLSLRIELRFVDLPHDKYESAVVDLFVIDIDRVDTSKSLFDHFGNQGPELDRDLLPDRFDEGTAGVAVDAVY